MAGEVAIPKDLLTEFRQSIPLNDGAENSSAAGEGSGELYLKSLEKSLGWLITLADKKAKKSGYPGVEDLSAEELAELTTIVLKRNLSAGILEKSPELMLFGVLTAITTQNLLASPKNKNIGNAEEQPRNSEDKG